MEILARWWLQAGANVLFGWQWARGVDKGGQNERLGRVRYSEDAGDE